MDEPELERQQERIAVSETLSFTLDSPELIHLREADAILGAVIEKVAPVELNPGRDPFRSLAGMIAGQQLSVAAADTIWRRFVALVGTVDAKTVAAADLDQIRSIGLSRSKATYITGLARGVLAGEFRLDELDHLSDEDVIVELTRIKGVGRWTAEMFLIFSLGRLDVFAPDDVGLRRAMDTVYGREGDDIVREQITEAWRPYRSLASLCLWKSLDSAPAV